MKGSRPPQAPLTANNDLSKTAETLAVIDSMILTPWIGFLVNHFAR
jgi:hypothetical protein